MLSKSSFGKEAMIEMMNTLTHDRFRNQLVTVLAGYELDINRLMASNPGLVSRFPVVINFDHLSVTHCVDLLLHCLTARGLDTRVLQAKRHVGNTLEVPSEKLTFLPSWGNARDVQTLAKAIYMRIMSVRTSQVSLIVHEKTVIEEITAMAKQRRTRVSTARHPRRDWHSTDGPAPREDARALTLPPPPQLRTMTSAETKKKSVDDQSSPEPRSKSAPTSNGVTAENDPEARTTAAKQAGAPADVHRDRGVPEEVWRQLQLDKQAAEQRQTQLSVSRQMMSSLAQQADEVRRRIAMGTQVELWTRRLEDLLTKHAAYSKALKRGESEAREEKRIQGLLKGVCPNGYAWTRQEGGWRCGGGQHFVGWEQLARGNEGDVFEVD